MELIASVFYEIARHSIIAMFSGYALALIIVLVSAKISYPALKTPLRVLAVFIFIYSSLNIFFGHTVSGNLINITGENGTAITVNTRQTNNQYNDYWVYEHSVIIETREGRKVEATFEDSDFNIYPKPEEGYIYPNIGERYSVRYLKRNPEAFVIKSDDGSPYARRLRCGSLLGRLNEAKLKYGFDNSNAEYKKRYEELIEECLRNECFDNALIQFYKSELEKLR